MNCRCLSLSKKCMLFYIYSTVMARDNLRNCICVPVKQLIVPYIHRIQSITHIFTSSCRSIETDIGMICGRCSWKLMPRMHSWEAPVPILFRRVRCTNARYREDGVNGSITEEDASLSMLLSSIARAWLSIQPNSLKKIQSKGLALFPK